MYKILLVDDEILVRKAMRENLPWEEMGYELIGDCENGRDAIEVIENHHVDVVLTDIAMPHMDGMGLSKYLAEHHPEIIIIILSGFEEFEYAKKAIQYKVSEYLLKPVTSYDMKEVLERARIKLEDRKREDTQKENMKLATKEYKKNKEVIRSQALMHLISGTKDTAECMRELKNMNVTIPEGKYRVASIDIDLLAIEERVSAEEKKESALMSFVVYNISQEILNEYDAGIAFQESGHRICLLLITRKPMEFLEQVSVITKRIQDAVKSAMGLKISIGIGEYADGLEGLYLSYESCKKALAYRYILGEGLIFDMEKEKPYLDTFMDMDYYVKKIGEAAKKCEEEDIEELFESLRQEMIERKIKKEKAIIYMQQILRGLEEVLNPFLTEQDFCQREQADRWTKIAVQNTFSEGLEVVKKYGKLAVSLIREAGNSVGKKQAILALEYIDRHYGESDLSLNSICNYLGMSTSYFSTVFKNETGETFMEVLIKKRMEQAKELLTHTSMKNYEIAEKIGFADAHYFSIAFKKMTGKTPKEYSKEQKRK